MTLRCYHDVDDVTVSYIVILSLKLKSTLINSDVPYQRVTSP